jgi:oxygen-independent coproporphyrinogen-3 oxidase
MRLIDPLATTSPDLARLLDEHARADYVYMYPPRQAYRPVPAATLDEVVAGSLARRGPVNLYFHYPFCRQICAFCNLYTTAGGSAEQHRAYTDALLIELDAYAPLLVDRPVDTVYIGGGTPSAVDPREIRRVFDRLADRGLCEIDHVAEVALEVAPDTATADAMRVYRDIGVNRVNLGVQTADPDELRLVGRRDALDEHLRGLDNAQAAGFANVCVDLIYGLDGQTDATWRRSLDAVIARRPETVCCYPLTLRPNTGLAARGYAGVDGPAMYGRYDDAHAALTAAGYEQQTHVRWALPAGGYRQKANHWACQDIVGVGAGARGYLRDGDYRNGYSVRSRTAALRAWHHRVADTGHGRDSGFVLDDDERRRRAVILGLGLLERAAYAAEHGSDPLDHFPDELTALADVGAVDIADDAIALTPLGQRHRDVIVQPLFSDRVRRLVAEFDYNE